MTAAKPYRLCLVLLGLIGVMINTGLRPTMFLYYTTMSNLLCIVYFLYLLWPWGRRHSVNENFKGAVTLAITVTMLIYWAILMPSGLDLHSVWDWTGSLLVHLVVPCLVIGDWLLFDRKAVFAKWAPWAWLVLPLSYFVFALGMAKAGVVYPNGAHYPYFFINADQIGWPAVDCYVVGLTLFFLLFGYGLKAVDGRFTH
ncbi:Pr6Pr family membrane protein [Leuconostocaceae bacterium ESL0958]|nr:Pr6Pr family membrane protein [Leuconostocaceae bacterium ESL0958]